MKRHIFALAAVLASAPAVLSASTLLNIDLSVENQLTISAGTGLSDITASGTNFTGIYISNFFSSPGIFPAATLISSDFSTFNNPTDGTPQLWRASANDLGLNVWTFSTDNVVSVTEGQQAFTGSATWSVSNAVYNDLLTNGGRYGQVFFPADSVDDTVGQTPIGRFSVAPVPLPAPVLMLGAALLGFGWIGRRRNAGRRFGTAAQA